MEASQVCGYNSFSLICEFDVQDKSGYPSPSGLWETENDLETWIAGLAQNPVSIVSIVAKPLTRLTESLTLDKESALAIEAAL